jgi:hypothetical protein
VTLVGAAPIEVTAIFVNGQEYPVVWTGITNWSMQLTLSSGLNDLTLQAFDASGNPLANDTSRIRVTFNGQSGSPAGQVLINEWMAANTSTIVNPATSHFDDWFELYFTISRWTLPVIRLPTA